MPQSTKKILMVVGDFNEDLEVYFPYQALLMLNHEMDTVSPGKSKGDHIVTAVHDSEPGLQTYTEKRGHNFPITANFADIDLDKYDALVIPGGRASEYQRLNADILKIVKHFDQKNLPIACICHGIQILAVAGILAGRKCTTVPFCEPDVTVAGGQYVDAGLDGVVVDRNLVTGSTWLGNANWLREFIQLLA